MVWQLLKFVEGEQEQWDLYLDSILYKARFNEVFSFLVGKHAYKVEFNIKAKTVKQDHSENRICMKPCGVGIFLTPPPSIGLACQTYPNGLSWASLSNAHKVSTRESHGPALRLDRSGLYKSLLHQCGVDVGWKTRLVKGGHWPGNLVTFDKDILRLPKLFNVSLNQLCSVWSLPNV